MAKNGARRRPMAVKDEGAEVPTRAERREKIERTRGARWLDHQSRQSRRRDSVTAQQMARLTPTWHHVTGWARASPMSHAMCTGATPS
jgi:hypothetical protein